MNIRFGTYGWKAIIADDCTFGNVHRVTEATCQYLQKNGDANQKLIVGHDSRFMSERFCEVAAEIAKSKEFKARLCDHQTEIDGRKIKSINRLDGEKFLFEDGTRMLMRPSGTEPMVRVYAEADNKKELEVLLEQGRNYLLG